MALSCLMLPRWDGQGRRRLRAGGSIRKGASQGHFATASTTGTNAQPRDELPTVAAPVHDEHRLCGPSRPWKVLEAVGPRTRGALSDYQKAEGLKVTGRLDDETRAKLGM